MNYYNGTYSRKRMMLVFIFVIAVILMRFPVNASAKTSDPKIVISKQTLYVGYKQYGISLSNLEKGASVTCVSSNNKVARVDKGNKVTAVKPGKATIAVTIKQNSKIYKDKIVITVKKPYIKITESIDTMVVDSSKKWKAKAYGIKNATLTWSTSDSSVATVNTITGEVTALSEGKVSITVSSGSLEASKTMVVKPQTEEEDAKGANAAEKFKLQWDSRPSVLTVEEFDRFAVVEENLPSAPVWSVSDSTLATIDEQGWLTALRTGTVVVTAQVGSQRISAPLLILTDEDYIDFVRGNYTPSYEVAEYIPEINEEGSIPEITTIENPLSDITLVSDKTPDPVITKPTPVITPKPVVTPALAENTSGYTYQTSSEGIIITGLQDTNIQNAIIPSKINGKKVVKIKTYAFTNLVNLKSIVIPDTVSVVEYLAIKDCPNLESLTLPSSVTSMTQIFGCQKLKYLTIGMKEIDKPYFRYCIGLERITVLDGVEEIGGFDKLPGLTEVQLPESLKVITDNAFAGCEKLVKINIPNRVTEIGERAFSDCYSLTGLSIADNFKGSIEKMAFEYTPIGSIGGAYKYNCTGVLNEADMELLNIMLDIINSVCKPSDSNGLKVLAIHDWIVTNTVYDYDNYINGTVPPISYTMEGILLQHSGVCEGYAETFKEFMDIIGIPCKVVIGMAGGTGHAWNLVYLDGDWYHIDCTWDDPVPDQGTNYISYNYCLTPDFIMAQADHEWIRNTYPAANGTKWTDYVNNQRYKD